VKVKVNYVVEGSYEIEEDTLKDILDVDELPETLSAEDLDCITECEEGGSDLLTESISQQEPKLTLSMV
jgi:hypothetical protein